MIAIFKLLRSAKNRDIIRHKLVKYIVEAYGREDGKVNDEQEND